MGGENQRVFFPVVGWVFSVMNQTRERRKRRGRIGKLEREGNLVISWLDRWLGGVTWLDGCVYLCLLVFLFVCMCVCVCVLIVMVYVLFIIFIY